MKRLLNIMKFKFTYADFLSLSGSLSSICSNFINFQFFQVLLFYQSVSGLTQILGHTLDILISPCNSDFVHNVSVGDFFSDHAVIQCRLDFSHPTTCIEKNSLLSWVSQD